MGKQSARMYSQGKDHKDIYFQGHYHDKMYKGSQLVWEKLKEGILWEGYKSTGADGFVRYNGRIFLYLDKNGNMYTSTDAVKWTVTQSPYADSLKLNYKYLTTANGVFICGKAFRYYNPHYGDYKTSYQIATSSDGIKWNQINSVNVINTNGTLVKYSIDGEDAFVPRFERILYANGKYFSSSIGAVNSSIAYSSDLINWHKFKIQIGSYEASSIETVLYVNGYYYIGVTAGSDSYVVRTLDLKEYEILFTDVGAKNIWEITKFADGLALHYKNDIYFSGDGIRFEKLISAFPESYPFYDTVRANIYMASSKYVLVNANVREMYEFTEIQKHKYIKFYDIFGFSVSGSEVSVIADNKKIYIFVNDSDTVYSLIGELEEQ